MSKNGRAWTEGFVVTVSKGDKSVDVTFDIVTNEGGGLYGYVLDSAVHGNKIENLKNFKTSFKLTIEELLR